MDRLMQALGYRGNPSCRLIVGFGCNVPSVMGARYALMRRANV